MSRIRTNLVQIDLTVLLPFLMDWSISGVTTVTTLDLNGDLDVDGHYKFSKSFGLMVFN